MQNSLQQFISSRDTLSRRAVWNGYPTCICLKIGLSFQTARRLRVSLQYGGYEVSSMAIRGYTHVHPISDRPIRIYISIHSGPPQLCLLVYKPHEYYSDMYRKFP